ncbi:pre-mRNA-splicing factor cwc25-like isoform X1 [Sorghum bicolor]|uniref:Uncharacterized protein n=3 Tax=Sorghum bicolor TaxID=4558 RepID=A0A1W0VXE1_SORBI|nr:pre-mRNA-splicing factor cwc25-like isoform X1 [Sorghum bicolor]OQU86766.1 hypothetical protein SORBI_3003G141600 [Sorghum bicolor]|eukprot:XP_021313177.1 pre-mRNA-splicing factor cwc25-like isoform X1 [Sorghum bicolor]
MLRISGDGAMEPKVAVAPEKDDRVRESRRCRSSGREEDPDEAQRRSKRSNVQTRHPGSPDRRIRDYRQEEEMHREHGDHDAMSHRRHHHHRYKDDDYGDRSSRRRHDDRSSSRRHDDRSSHRRHDDSPPEESPGDRKLRLDGGKHGQDVSEAQEPSVEPQLCLVLENLFDKCVVEPFVDSLKMDSVLLKDVKADAHEMCATKGGTVTNVGVDPYAGKVYVRFRDVRATPTLL